MRISSWVSLPHPRPLGALVQPPQTPVSLQTVPGSHGCPAATCFPHRAHICLSGPLIVPAPGPQISRGYCSARPDGLPVPQSPLPAPLLGAQSVVWRWRGARLPPPSGASVPAPGLTSWGSLGAHLLRQQQAPLSPGVSTSVFGGRAHRPPHKHSSRSRHLCQGSSGWLRGLVLVEEGQGGGLPLSLTCPFPPGLGLWSRCATLYMYHCPPCRPAGPPRLTWPRSIATTLEGAGEGPGQPRARGEPAAGPAPWASISW